MTAFGWRRAAWTFLGTLLIVNCVLVLGIRTGRWDAIDYFVPYYTLVADAARQGQLLLWTPLVDGGCPVGYEPQVGAASPLQLILGLATGGNEFGFRLYWLTIWGLGGCGVLLLARHLAAPAWAACVAAVGFAFSAIYISHASHTSYLVTMSLFPWVLWRLDAAILRRSWFAAVQAGALWGLSALGGYPGLVLAGGGYAVAWTFGRLFLCQIKPRPSVAPRLVASQGATNGRGFIIILATFFIAGLAVLSPTYAGFWAESRGYTSRAAALSRETALGGGLPPAALATFASPYLSEWNSKSDCPVWRADVTMSSIYLSPLLLVLALNLQGVGGNARFRRFLAIVAIFYLLASLGGATPLYGWLYDLVPPLRFLRFAAGFRCHYIVTVVVLALLTAAAYRETPPGPAADAFWKGGWRASLALGGLAAVAFTAVAWAAAGGQHDPLGLVLAVVHLVVVWAAIVWLFHRGCNAEESVRQRIVCRHFVSLAVLDAALTMAVGHGTVCGKATVWRAAAAEHVVSADLTRRGLDRRPSTEAMGLPPNGNFLSKTPVLASYAGMVNSFHREYVRRPILSAAALGAERIWFAPSAVETPPSADAFELFATAAQRLGRPCLVVAGRKDCLGPPGAATADSPVKVAERLLHAPPAEPIAVALREYSPNRLIFDVEAPGDGWLLVTDRWASGWQATVNGRDADVWLGNFIFRAVRVSRGANRVAFAYRPFGHPWLLLLSWTTLGAAALGSKRGTGALSAPNHGEH